MKKAIVPVALAAALGFSQQVNAIHFDGFLTAGFAIHDQEDATQDITYLDSITDDLRFDNDSKFGLQVTADSRQQGAEVKFTGGRGGEATAIEGCIHGALLCRKTKKAEASAPAFKSEANLRA